MKISKVTLVLDLELKGQPTDKEAENLAAEIERVVGKLDGYPGLMARVDSGHPGVLNCTVVDFTGEAA